MECFCVKIRHFYVLIVTAPFQGIGKIMKQEQQYGGGDGGDG